MVARLLLSTLRQVAELLNREGIVWAIGGGVALSVREVIGVPIKLLNEKGLKLPREEILHNAFVLWPLAEIAPDLMHPSEQRSMATLWQGFDKDSQKLWPVTIDW